MKKALFLILTILMCAYASFAFAAENNKDYPKENLVGETTYEEMEQLLDSGEGANRVFLKQGDDAILVFKGLAQDVSACKQIILALPEEKLFQVYSNDKKSTNNLFKAARDFSKKLVIMNGHNVVAEKNETVKVSATVSIHKFWLKKFVVESNPQTVRVRRRGLNLPIGIGIGIGRHGHGHIGIGL